MDIDSGSVRNHLDGVAPEKRRQDAEKLLKSMGRVTGERPRLWGSITVLEAIVAESYRTLTADTYGQRAREGAATPPDE